jgi:PAS domain S-box-containing protein
MLAGEPIHQSHEDLFATSEHDPLGTFRAVFEAAPYGVVVAGEDGTILFTNSLVNTTFTFSPGELLGQPISRLVPAASGEHWQEFWTSLQSRGTALDRNVSGTRKDGTTVPLEIGLNVFKHGASRYIVASIVDLTDRRHVEAPATGTTDFTHVQRLIAEIVIRFGGADAGALDETIVDSLRQIGEALQLDRAILWRRNPEEPTAAVATHFWVRDPQLPPDPRPLTSPYVISRLKAGQACCFTRSDDLPNPIDRETFRRHGIRSCAVFPLAFSGQDDNDISALAFASMTREQVWAPEITERLRLVAGVIGQAIVRARGHRALQKAVDEIKSLRDRLSAENVELRREVRVLRTSSGVVSDSPAMKRVLGQIEQVAPTTATVLLLGETGTGKEVMAEAIHNLSPRHGRQMVRVSCAAIPTALIESELFGRERGAYTGALSRQIGRFELANQSTLFLDEIGDLPMDVQVKLLRVLQERVLERLGSTQPIKVDVRIIAATNRNLEQAVRDKTFREDLFYRLNVFPIVVPPLRERTNDVPGLVWSFVDEFSKAFGKPIDSVSKDSMRDLQRYTWPGNVRELRNVIERAIIVSTGRQLVVPAPRPQARVPSTAMTLQDLEQEHIRSVLDSTNWRVRGVGGAAERLGLKPTTLESRMARLGLRRKQAP